MLGAINFWISCRSNFVTKNAVDFSGSLIERSVLIVNVSARPIVAFFWRINSKNVLLVLFWFL